MKKERKYDKNLIREFIKDNNLKSAEDVQNALEELFAETLQEMLEAELYDSLGYPKNGKKDNDTSNRRNGHASKNVRSEYGDIDLEIPRDREGDFNSIRYVSYKDVKKVTADLRLIYTSPTEEAGLEELDKFEKKWGEKYPLIVRSWHANWAEISTFFKYPPEIRKIIYTTNMIESYTGN